VNCGVLVEAISPNDGIRIRAFESIKHHGIVVVENVSGERLSGDDFDERICRFSSRANSGSSSIRVELFSGNFIIESVFHKPPNVPERVFHVFKHSTHHQKHRRADTNVQLRV
jgi:hypothetical protein